MYIHFPQRIKMPEIPNNTTFKNWVEFCDIYDIPNRTGTTRVKMKERLEAFYIVEHSGHQFTIVKLRDEVLPIKKPEQYVQYGREVFLGFIQDDERVKNRRRWITKESELAQILGFYNSSFSDDNYRVEELSKEIGVSMTITSDFFTTVRDKVEHSIARILDDIINKDGIIRGYSNTYFFITKDKDRKDIFKELNGDEVDIYMQCQQDTIRRDMQLSNISHVFQSGRWSEYQSILAGNLPEALRRGRISKRYKIILGTGASILVPHFKDNFYGDCKTLLNELFFRNHIKGTERRRKYMINDIEEAKCHSFGEPPPSHFVLSSDRDKLLTFESTMVQDNVKLAERCLLL